MPIYVYACRECEHQFEEVQGIAEDPLTICPECGAEALHKVPQGAAFDLRGPGFHDTDYTRYGRNEGAVKRIVGNKANEGSREERAKRGRKRIR